jgi:hypothetical protein
MDRAKVFEAIDRERCWQEQKWGTNQDHPHTVGEWLLIIESELNEAKQGWVKGRGDADALSELIQVAAVAVAALEQHGAIERPWRALNLLKQNRIRWTRTLEEEAPDAE